ncbi:MULTISPECIES: Gfo/Idh/MocA family protein [Microbacterium]|uniref:Gfo/Idh/MocA family oxidoreductase n=1 Tax=Microbacterium wangchenii TaxID=2541726 RepID=A0ABX5SX67_9MICO|nr:MULTISPECIES: Gfo/Idh/MocA family oxidoreductase [Microbacterium]MCK6067679.1 Gfo/Idh/MocA family oxidoreductase [Microbacterium sp. EYE_512]QBR89405.1 Gfo/Idh/MocA family oxidoreductase [Microbacterium wangchenii]TFV81530.1 Gfo/Idh/MocA family oxidoreductase [Microbacterium sp. dk485]TXK11078.1 Gfo/Idh/MocA family oxidoreductase [Microbacterium wangchenii]
MSRLRWGILATGGIAHSFTRELQGAGHLVTAVGSRRAESAEAFAREFGLARAHGSYEALVADPEVDIVYVATPHPAHAENALLALDSGKHVLVEKPFTLTGDEAERVRERAEERGLVALEAMWTRFLPHMARIREIVAAGTLGEIRTVTAEHTQRLPTDPSHRLNDLALGGGALLDLGIYPISFVHDILGAPVTIAASARFADTGADTEVATIFTHASGALSTTLSSSRGAGPNRASIVGTEARIDIDRVWYTPTSFQVVAADGTVVERYENSVAGGGKQFQAQHVEELVASGRLSGDVLPLAESVEIMRTLDRVRAEIGLRYPGEH